MSQMPPPPQQPPGGYGYPGGSSYPGGSAGAASSTKGFFGALFDFSFETFVTPMIVKVVYVLALVGLGLGYLGFVVVGFADSVLSGLLVLIFGALGFVIYLALIRMALEFYVAITRMSQDIHQRLPRS